MVSCCSLEWCDFKTKQTKSLLWAQINFRTSIQLSPLSLNRLTLVRWTVVLRDLGAPLPGADLLRPASPAVFPSWLLVSTFEDNFQVDFKDNIQRETSRGHFQRVISRNWLLEWSSLSYNSEVELPEEAMDLTSCESGWPLQLSSIIHDVYYAKHNLIQEAWPGNWEIKVPGLKG